MKYKLISKEKILKVYTYLDNYFNSDKNYKPINPCDVNIDGLTPIDINIVFAELNNIGLIQHIN